MQAKRQRTLAPEELVAAQSGARCTCDAISSAPQVTQFCTPVSMTMGIAAAASVGSAAGRVVQCCPHGGEFASGDVIAGDLQQRSAVGGDTASSSLTDLVMQGDADELPVQGAGQADHHVEAFALPPEEEMLYDGLQGLDEIDEDIFDHGGDLGPSAYHN